MEGVEPRLLFATFTVTSTADSGAGTLRQAILDANGLPGLDTIAFSIGTTPRTIAPTSALPDVTNPVVIDGSTQPGYAGVPLIELSGASSGSSFPGLVISSGGSTVRGLAINRFKHDGIQFLNLGGNTLQGNYIGTTLAGTSAAANTGVGVYVQNSPNNLVGGSTFSTGFSARNLISGNTGDGIFIEGARSSGNSIKNNYIGTNTSGGGAVPNGGNGVLVGIGAHDNVVGGTSAADRNVISGNSGDGVQIAGDGAANNLILGNYVGLRASGSAALANAGNGILIDGAFGSSGLNNNVIGGTISGSRNVISGNARDGVKIVGDGAAGTFVQGNYLGTDANGSAAVANRQDGINIVASAGHTVGGTIASARNVISGNLLNGVEIQDTGATGNFVQGNYVGTNAAGSAALANVDDGVDINSTSGNTVGGTVAGAGNVISGNGSDGIEIAVDALRFDGDAANNLVQGNFIGTNATGTSAIGNTDNGVRLIDHTGSGTRVTDNTIGGPSAAARNVISGNKSHGVRISGLGATGNYVQGNSIGTNAAGTGALPNGLAADAGSGIGVYLLSSGNFVGGTAPGEGNTIAFNLRPGIQIEGAANANSLRANSVHDNGGLGIDLFPLGVTPNDSLDSDAGPNDLQNFPLLTSATSSADTTSIQGTFSGKPSTTLTLDFYAGAPADPSGNGEGATYLASGVITTNASGAATFSFSFAAALAAGQKLTATATDSAGNTSEFSAAIGLASNSSLAINGDAGGVPTNDTFRLARNASDPSLLDVYVNSPTPTSSLAYSSITRVTVNGLAGDDRLILDYANGTPVVTEGVLFSGGAGAGDALEIVGRASDTFSIASDVITRAADAVSFSGAELLAAGGGAFNFTSDATGLRVEALNSSILRFDTTQHLASLLVQSGATAVLTPGGAKLLRTSFLQIDLGGTLDLSDNDLVWQAANATDAVAARNTLESLVALARNGGTWDAPGLTSSAARNDLQRLTGLAIVRNINRAGAALRPTFDGESADANAVIVKYSWTADADADGRITPDDYFRIDAGFLARANAFAEGNFNFDGRIDLNDYATIDTLFLSQDGVW